MFIFLYFVLVLNVAILYLHNVQMEAPSRDVSTVTKRKKTLRFDKIRIPRFVEQVQNIIDANPETFTRDSTRDLHVFEIPILNAMHEYIRYKSYVMTNEQANMNNAFSQQNDY